MYRLPPSWTDIALALFCLFLMALACIPVSPTVRAASQERPIVYTYERESGEPIGGVELHLVRNGTRLVRYSNLQGDCFTDGLPRGIYRVTPVRKGWTFTPKSGAITVAPGADGIGFAGSRN